MVSWHASNKQHDFHLLYKQHNSEMLTWYGYDDGKLSKATHTERVSHCSYEKKRDFKLDSQVFLNNAGERWLLQFWENQSWNFKAVAWLLRDVQTGEFESYLLNWSTKSASEILLVLKQYSLICNRSFFVMYTLTKNKIACRALGVCSLNQFHVHHWRFQPFWYFICSEMILFLGQEKGS